MKKVFRAALLVLLCLIICAGLSLTLLAEENGSNTEKADPTSIGGVVVA